ncbi:VIT domain-containing protein [Flavobacterium fluviale]|uniref:VIT domain-containing protein n=1 Tax=Flavobacterium fluviale TaxID=2249356 RepID=UPI001E3B6C1E|nr:VIT domain-containing protein [Flavobacterium fluviale]
MSENFYKKLNLLFCAILLFAAKTFAQSPELTAKGENSENVRMSQLIVNVKVVGNIAYTTAEMHFFNSGNRQMEAELIFPLPENVSVSRYAIDINGKMREAVPVNKNKGQQVFEAIEHRRVDPGLLEKVDGNNFRTRIYPLMPNAERIVIIGYEEELSALDKNNLAYQLVSRYPEKLDKFEINLSVLGSSIAPQITENSGQEIAFSKWNQSFQTSFKKENYKPSEKLVFKIPIQENTPSVLMQNVDGQYYFYGNTFVEGNKTAKKTPNSIGLIWDNSLSCQTRDLQKELRLLDAYFEKIQNTKVTLYFLNYTFEKQKEFEISAGNWSELRAVLEKTKYDGGTRFSQINFSNHDEYMFFSDGLSSLSDAVLPKTKKPIYTITSAVSADFAFLNYSAMQTGGSFINLNQLDFENALDKLVNTNLKFLGIKDNYAVTDLFPIKGTSVSGNFGFSGISLKAKNEVTLLFGYTNEVVLERKITLNAVLQNTTDVNIEKLWAQKKIANLEFEYAKNAEEIEILGKKYGIITKNTSLIVLEDIHDYILYDIIPPAELREEFDRIKKNENDRLLVQQKNNWKIVGYHFEELKSWWKKDIKYSAAKSLQELKVEKVHNQNPVTLRKNSDIPVGMVSGIVLDLDDFPFVGVSVSTNGEEVYTDFDGKFSIKADENSVLSFSFNSVFFQLSIEGNNYVTVRLEDKSLSREVVVLGLGRRRLLSLILNGSRFEESGIYVSPVFEPPLVNIRLIPAREEEVIGQNNIKNHLKKWNPDRLYLKALASAPKEKQYELYFELRKEQERNPSFYFDIAHFFYNQGDVKKALQIVSNIADIGLDNYQLYKTLTYTLRQWQNFDDALFTAKQIVKRRAHEPQSLRDYALALEDAGKYQEAFDQLIKALEVNYYQVMDGQYKGVEDIILMDINRLITEHRKLKTGQLDKKYLKKLPVDIRIVMNWNLMDVDLDLHVIEPNGEECYYRNKNTKAGARFSKDFTQGYGPEQYLIRNAIKGKYVIKSNYYGERKLTENGPATVLLEIYITKAGKTSKTLKTIQLGKIKENEILAEIVW